MSGKRERYANLEGAVGDVQWRSEMPSHWKRSSVKRIFTIVGGSTPKSEEPELWDGDIVWVTPADLGKLDSRLVKQSARNISAQGLKSSSTSLVPPGSIIISTRAPIGSIGISEVALCFNQGCKALVPRAGVVDAAYYYYYLSVSTEALSVFGKGTTFLELSANALGMFSLPLPPLREQQAITAYLDRETTSIDELIGRQKLLVTILNERRRAIISHVVTKGLDNLVPTKKGKIGWLGDVPAHWDVIAMKHVVAIPVTDGPHETPNFIDDGVPFISAEAVGEGKINFEKRRGDISEEDHRRYSAKYSPKLHDIYMVKAGATTGVTAILETDAVFNIWSPLAVIRGSDKVHPYFLLNVLRSMGFQNEITLKWNFGTQQNIGMGVIENLTIPLPPISEQKAIAQYLSVEVAKINRLTEKALLSIALMQERRSALISAVVTGKVDVTGAS